MKTLKIILLLAIVTISLHSNSFYTRELKEEIRQWKEEKVLRDAKKNMLACNELSSSLEFINKNASNTNAYKKLICLEDKKVD